MKFLLPLFALAVATAAAADSPTLPAPAARTVDFVKDIQPIFEAQCVKCHGPEKQKGGYRLDDRKIALTGGDDHAPNIHPGKSAESPLIQFVAGLDPDMKMPAKGDPLTAEQIGLLRAWIDQGAVWPEVGEPGEKRSARLVVAEAARAAAGAGRGGPAEGEESDRRLHPREARGEEALAFHRRRCAHAHPAHDLRSHRPAADAGGGRRLRRPRRSTTGRRRSSSSPTGCSLRRATASAGRGIGWMWSTTATRTATTRTSCAPTRGRIAITSSAR